MKRCKRNLTYSELHMQPNLADYRLVNLVVDQTTGDATVPTQSRMYKRDVFDVPKVQPGWAQDLHLQPDTGLVTALPQLCPKGRGICRGVWQAGSGVAGLTG